MVREHLAVQVDLETRLLQAASGAPIHPGESPRPVTSQRSSFV